MKKIIILKHGGGELANQLWNYASIYAYGLESGRKVENPSFFEYHHSFNFLKHENGLTRFFSSPFSQSSGRRGNRKNVFWRTVYLSYVRIIEILFKNSIISSENERSQVTYLPPTSMLPVLTQIERGYYLGWLFRNPVGLKKFRREIISAFAPNGKIENRVSEIIMPLRQKYEKIIGIHIRQADYKIFKGGAYFVSQTRAMEIISEYVRKNSIDSKRILFLVTSDGPIDVNVFCDLNVYISKENAITDLFLLSATDLIIGSDSSFGAFAGWYGNIPHLVMENGPIDWTYYADKKEYFENKYSRMVHY